MAEVWSLTLGGGAHKSVSFLFLSSLAFLSSYGGELSAVAAGSRSWNAVLVALKRIKIFKLFSPSTRVFFSEVLSCKKWDVSFLFVTADFSGNKGSKPALIVTKERGRKERKKEKSGATKKKRFLLPLSFSGSCEILISSKVKKKFSP